MGLGEARAAVVIWLVKFYQNLKLLKEAFTRISQYTHNTMTTPAQDVEALVHSDDPNHPANHICALCAKFYTLGWVRATLPADVAR